MSFLVGPTGEIRLP
uniref:Uncharacterized protein n=4 Tax=Lactuca TaxID=4235 RepID=A0A8F4XJ21_LACSI|nr:hypothetical protein [Lactuca sativa var. capitata]QXI86797.1 hypothetical protein [Lactuca saligna]QXI86842.1 hypothetical protein [Lactuca serriola]QXI86927.1 hypothetical protein [Lactuca virosa]QXI86713.1 hypothetical protein [Lactuca sativa var. capitata]